MNHQTNHRVNWFYIPVETKTREFHAKILLACVAAENGLTAVIGQKSELRRQISHLPKGFFLYYGIAENFLRDIQNLKEAGLTVVAVDEEGLVYYSCDFYQRYRVSCQVLHDITHFFAWGKNQAQCIASKCPEEKQKIVLAGNPRFDLLRPEFREFFRAESDAIKAKYGKFLLINTNFGACNHFNGPEFYIQSLWQKGWTCSAEDEAYHLRRIEHVAATFDFFRTMISEVSKAFPEYTIIVRPHPSESIKHWQQILCDCQNVHIMHEGNVVSWLLAADLLIYNGCTTGIEGAIAGTPIIVYSPIPASEYDVYLPNALGYRVVSVDELIRTIREVQEHGPGFLYDYSKRRIKELLGEFASNLNGDLASDRIISTLTHKEFTGRFSIMPFPVAKFDMYMYNFISRAKKFAAGKLCGRGKRSADYLKHKFNGTSISEVEAIVKYFQHCSGRFGDIEVTEIADQIFIFSKKPS